MNVATRFNYTDREYQAFDRGYQVVYLEKDVAKTLFAYMSATHEFLPPRTKADKKVFIKRKKSYKTTVADTVANYIKSNSVRDEMMLSNFRSIDKKNHYLFLNNRFGPLNDAYWNSLLKKVMVDEHIGIDTGRKKFGLNHRFRHGFAMFLLYKMELNVFEVAKLMRHHSVSSLEPYLKLTTEGILELRNRYTSDIYDVIKKYVHENDLRQ